MLDLIACCLAWVGASLARTHRCSAPPRAPRVLPSVPLPRAVWRGVPSWAPPAPAGETAIDGHALDIVRPYVRAMDDPDWRRALRHSRDLRRQRRRELVLAVLGQDGGPLDIHGVRVGPSRPPSPHASVPARAVRSVREA